MSKPTRDRDDIRAAASAARASFADVSCGHGQGAAIRRDGSAPVRQTYVVTRDDAGALNTRAGWQELGRVKSGAGTWDNGWGGADGLAGRGNLPGGDSVSARGAGTANRPEGPTFFDSQSVYLLAWQTAMTRVTVTSFCDERAVSSATICIGSDPTRLVINWGVIDRVRISYEGTPGLSVRGNFLLV
jgi:hypothetical protein